MIENAEKKTFRCNFTREQLKTISFALTTELLDLEREVAHLEKSNTELGITDNSLLSQRKDKLNAVRELDMHLYDYVEL